MKDKRKRVDGPPGAFRSSRRFDRHNMKASMPPAWERKTPRRSDLKP